MSSAAGQNKNSFRYQSLLALSALGVVYGDIGTSPLYAIRESVHHGHMGLAPANVYGILSLIFWALMLVITVKYLFYILRADNKGEGGILALTSLITHHTKETTGSKKILILLGLFGTALLYGDGMITPAISVLSAVEGLGLITPHFEHYIVPITIIILLGLFSMQKHGTSTVGKIFGPLTLLWFLTLGCLGIWNIIQDTHILMAINPFYAFQFFQMNTWHAFVALGSVFLVVTGGEALYSDMGHFGRRSIQQAWFFVALPCLLLNYFGQGSLLLRFPSAIKNPFFLMAPDWALTPLVILATIATVIASQALITGVFSITMHGIQLGYLPRAAILHTSAEHRGQIYVKKMNLYLMLACIALVIAFKTSSNLAAAYGLAVTTTMGITTILFYVVAREQWHWSKLKAGTICGFFLLIDMSFWGANMLKFTDGGWFPILVGAIIFTLMTTWKRGKQILAERLKEKSTSLENFLDRIDREKPMRVTGTAIYMASASDLVPLSLITSYEHFKSIHENLLFVSVVTEEVSVVEPEDRLSMHVMRHHCFQVIVHYGFMEMPNIPRDLKKFGKIYPKLKLEEATYIIGKENLFASALPGMAIWREHLFAIQSRNAQLATVFFQLPKKRVIEIGVQIDL